MVTINASVDATSFVITLSLSLVWSVGIVGVLEVPERPPAGDDGSGLEVVGRWLAKGPPSLPTAVTEVLGKNTQATPARDGPAPSHRPLWMAVLSSGLRDLRAHRFHRSVLSQWWTTWEGGHER